MVLKSNDFPVAGAVRLVEMYCAHLHRERVEPIMVHVNSPDKPPSLAQFSERLASCEHHVIEWQGLRRVKAVARQLNELIRKTGADVVTSNDMRTDLACRMAGGHRGMGIPWTVFVHGWIGWKRKWGDKRYGFYELVDRWCTRYADEVWVGSHAAGEYVKWSLPKSAVIKVLMNAMEPYYVRTTPERIAEVRAAMNLPPGTVLTGTLGRMAWAKGHALLAEAVVKSGCDNLVAVLMGFGEEEEKLKRMAETPPYKGRIFLPGPVASVEDMPAYLGALDFFCFPSLQESLPVAVMEAMYMDNAIAASATGDLPLVLEHGKAGLLFPPGDVDAMAECLRRLTRDVALREELRQRAKQRVLEDFTAPRYSLDLENAWVDLVERTRGARQSKDRRAPALSAGR
jgi:glycosyltransferase involved in cell wall biosynthesis